MYKITSSYGNIINLIYAAFYITVCVPFFITGTMRNQTDRIKNSIQLHICFISGKLKYNMKMRLFLFFRNRIFIRSVQRTNSNFGVNTLKSFNNFGVSDTFRINNNPPNTPFFDFYNLSPTFLIQIIWYKK